MKVTYKADHQAVRNGRGGHTDYLVTVVGDDGHHVAHGRYRSPAEARHVAALLADLLASSPERVAS